VRGLHLAGSLWLQVYSGGGKRMSLRIPDSAFERGRRLCAQRGEGRESEKCRINPSREHLEMSLPQLVQSLLRLHMAGMLL